VKRETKFRGLHNGQWVYGSLIQGKPTAIVSGIVELNDEYINIEKWSEVDPKTVGENTGLKDKNGKEIYEGDIVQGTQYVPDKMSVEFIEGGFCMTHPDIFPIDISHFYHSKGPKIEIISNIHENPELLKQE